MPLMVRFTVADTPWLAHVADVVEVRTAEVLRPLPDPEPGVVGIIDRDGHAHPVLDALGAHGHHVLLVRDSGAVAGLLADEVVGVDEIADEEFSPGPSGQRRPFVEATAGRGAELAYVLDTAALVRGVSPAKEMDHA